MALLRKKYSFLRPGVIQTLKVKAYAAGASSEWSDPIDILTSEYDRLAFGALRNLEARPKWWNRVIRVNWTPAWPTSLKWEERLSHYLIFRCESTDWNASLPLSHKTESSPYYLDNAGRTIFYIDSNIVEETTYYYWVYAVDKRGWESANYCGPDNAEFGKPETPTITSCSTDIHTYNKWWCDVTINWTCTNGAEYYLVQRKLSGSLVWGPMVYVEHDTATGDSQSVTLDNFRTNTAYNFRVKAVNIPIALVSSWGTYNYTTSSDSTAPEEVRDVDARRQRRFGISKGEFIRITWSRPDYAWYTQQITHYNIYRTSGSSTTASAYAATINAGNAAPLDQGYLLQGTQYIDDSVTTLSSGSYHYFVTAVDEYGNESTVTYGGESHDSVSFSPPATPTSLDVITNLVIDNRIFGKQYSCKLRWSDVDEATDYLIKYQLSNPRTGSYTPAFKHVINQSLAEDEDNPALASWVVPWPMKENSSIRFWVQASNTAGPSNWAGPYTESIDEDETPPSRPSTPIGTCVGIKGLFGYELWLAVVLRWRSNTLDEGVDHYEIWGRNSLRTGDNLIAEVKAHLGTYHHWYHLPWAGIPNPLTIPYNRNTSKGGGYWRYWIYAVDKAGQRSTSSSYPCQISWSPWWSMEQ